MSSSGLAIERKLELNRETSKAYRLHNELVNFPSGVLQQAHPYPDEPIFLQYHWASIQKI